MTSETSKQVNQGRPQSPKWDEAAMWMALQYLFASVAEQQGQRLREEWSWVSGGQQGDPEDLLRTLGSLRPEWAVREFEEDNPSLDLNRLQNLDVLSQDEMYPYAVGLLVMVSPGDEE